MLNNQLGNASYHVSHSILPGHMVTQWYHVSAIIIVSSTILQVVCDLVVQLLHLLVALYSIGQVESLLQLVVLLYRSSGTTFTLDSTALWVKWYHYYT